MLRSRLIEKRPIAEVILQRTIIGHTILTILAEYSDLAVGTFSFRSIRTPVNSVYNVITHLMIKTVGGIIRWNFIFVCTNNSKYTQ